MWYVVGLLFWVVVVAGVMVVYGRRRRQRDAERADRMAALLADVKSATGVAKVSAAGAAPAARAAAAEFRKKQRLLPPSSALLYYVFRTGLPDHEIFAGLTLADVLDAPAAANAYGPARSARLLAERLDLIVCTKQLDIVAGVLIGARMDAARENAWGQVAQCLHAAGIRALRVDPAAAPRHQDIRRLIYGDGA